MHKQLNLVACISCLAARLPNSSICFLYKLMIIRMQLILNHCFWVEAIDAHGCHFVSDFFFPSQKLRVAKLF